jgi:hypothetical protein
MQALAYNTVSVDTGRYRALSQGRNDQRGVIRI